MNQINRHSQIFIDYCQNKRRLSSATVRAYELDMESFLNFLKDFDEKAVESSHITKHTLEAYLDFLNQNFSVKTVRRRIASLRSFFNYLEYEDLIEDNPFRKFHMYIKDPFRVPDVLSLEEINGILAAAYGESPTLMPVSDEDNLLLPKKAGKKTDIQSKEFLWARDTAILEILFAGGLRVSELCNLTYQDLNLSRLQIKINGKGNKQRIIYLENAEVINALNRYLLLRDGVETDTTNIFISKFGKKLSTQAVRNLVEKYTKMAGITKKITPHTFRHSFASLLLEEGVDIKYIQDFLGHSSIATTQIYLHTSSREKRKIMATKHPRQKLVMEDIAPMANIHLHQQY
ncbi:tyrosine-type recombinase/integrase [Sinanaerobacter chloroacetimidivorans]|uniref:Tyrosine-type recombinase/integrase n=1 Tax=Sinanaerobacter chloroacetimidivorans TaxID=2818044 RepID=A0A8J7W3V9_9FIRM|nr:tyrosine-type recombinase/integrase [Sinanaerobacter chloroacetimidivorans]MBR0600422.1 tyrosine-type recombinase/integrase [Sinanaerobacter chloroacetimidivorans]